MSSRRQVRIACQYCRHKRAKCNSEHPCQRCERQGRPCEYSHSRWISKNSLRSEVKRLQQSLEGAISSRRQVLARTAATKDSKPRGGIDGFQSPVIDSSGGEISPKDAIEFPSGSVAEGTPRATYSLDTSTSTGALPCLKQLSSWQSCPSKLKHCISYKADPSMRASAEAALPSVPVHAYAVSAETDTWTETGWTRGHVRHLFDLLSTWDKVSFCILRQHEFLMDYETGASRFCSSALVHALLALSTRLMNGTECDDSCVSPPGWFGSKYFLHKAELLLHDQEPSYNLPNIQSMGILSFYHMRCGREKEAIELAHLCVAQVRSLCTRQPAVDSSDKQYLRVRAATYCGATSLLRMFHLTTGLLFNDIGYLQGDTFVLDDLPGDNNGAIATSSDASGSDATSIQLDHAQVLIVKILQLSEWVHKTVSASQRATEPHQDDLLAAYTKYFGWYRDMIELLGDSSSKCPFGLFIHMFYHFYLLCAFRPFLGCHFEGLELQPDEVCVQAAQSILALAQSYDNLFTLRHVSTFMPYFVCASGLFGLDVEDSGSIMELNGSCRGIPVNSAQQFQVPDVTAASFETMPSASIEASSIVQASMLLSKMGSSHPAAVSAQQRFTERVEIWRCNHRLSQPP